MKRRKLLALSLGLPLVLSLLSSTEPASAAAVAPVAGAQGILGTWINPHGTVKVMTEPCAGNLCGRIVWASVAAQADASDSGISRLVGTQLLRDYHRTAAGHYQGTVYVPDMGRSFFSTITQNSADSIRISGCILGGLICKSQDWRRV